MNQKISTIHSEIKELQLFLKKYPQEATELAIAYFEDYLILLSEYEKLEVNLKKIERGAIEFTSISKPIFAEIKLSLEQEFKVACLKLHLSRYPDESKIFALSYFEDFLYLVLEYQKLESRLLRYCCLSDAKQSL